jgi:hypothetical protein
MATILEFRRSAGRTEPQPAPLETGAGEIVLFPGVRYSREDYERVVEAAAEREPEPEDTDRTAG